jgi:general secretion pathway protein N
VSRVWRLVALGIGAYLLILVTTFPATRVSGMLQDRIAELSLNGISGTALSGEAAQLVYQGLDLGPLQWQFRPLALFLGRIEYQIELTHPDNHGRLRIGRSLTGRTLVHDVDMVLLPDRLINHYSPEAVDTSGTFHVVFDTFNPGTDYSGEVNGRIEWQDAVILEPISLVLGQIAIEVATENGELVGRVTDGGDLGVTGEITLSAAYAYRINLLLRPGAQIASATLDVLQHAAQRQPDGDYRIDASGQL